MGNAIVESTIAFAIDRYVDNNYPITTTLTVVIG